MKQWKSKTVLNAHEKKEAALAEIEDLARFITSIELNPAFKDRSYIAKANAALDVLREIVTDQWEPPFYNSDDIMMIKLEKKHETV
jgi:hypothetical protein